jgi:hypothetical protein
MLCGACASQPTAITAIAAMVAIAARSRGDSFVMRCNLMLEVQLGLTACILDIGASIPPTGLAAANRICLLASVEIWQPNIKPEKEHLVQDSHRHGKHRSTSTTLAGQHA